MGKAINLNRGSPSKAERYFATGLSMITTKGSSGSNVMTAEWVLQISYQPLLIAVFIHEGAVTLKNIIGTKEFGINVASQEQISEVSVSGGYSGIEVDKLRMKGVFKLRHPRKIKTPMIMGCTINAECKLVKWEKLGDHVMLVGRVLDIRHDDSKNPLIYHKVRYNGLGSILEPKRKKVNVRSDVFKFFKNLAHERFVLKCVGTIMESKNKILVIQWPENIETIPFDSPPVGKNQREYLIEFLKKRGLNFHIGKTPVMKRLTLVNGKNIQRINFVLFKGKSKKVIKGARLKFPKDDSFISALI